jgi:hypothetical protein
MIDLERLSQLYETAHNEEKTPEQRLKATGLLAEIDADALAAEYLSLPDNQHQDSATVGIYKWIKGQPRWASLDDLANYVAGWLRQNDGETNKEFFARMDRLKADKLGVLLRHRKHQQARPVRTTDFDVVRIFGDTFHLSVWWSYAGRPPIEREVIMP